MPVLRVVFHRRLEPCDLDSNVNDMRQVAGELSARLGTLSPDSVVRQLFGEVVSDGLMFNLFLQGSLRNLFFELVDVEFPRFRGHLLTEFAWSGRMSADAKDPALLVGVPLGGREVASQQWSFGPAARARARRFTAVVA
jgi:hypothetical protein